MPSRLPPRGSARMDHWTVTVATVGHRDDLVSAPPEGEVVEDDVLGAIDVYAVQVIGAAGTGATSGDDTFGDGVVPKADAEVANDDVLGADVEGVIAQGDARGTGTEGAAAIDGDVGLRNVDRGLELNDAIDGELHDAATGALDGPAKAASAAVAQVGHGIDGATTASLGIGAKAFGPIKGRRQSRQGLGRCLSCGLHEHWFLAAAGRPSPQGTEHKDGDG